MSVDVIYGRRGAGKTTFALSMLSPLEKDNQWITHDQLHPDPFPHWSNHVHSAEESTFPQLRSYLHTHPTATVLLENIEYWLHVQHESLHQLTKVVHAFPKIRWIFTITDFFGNLPPKVFVDRCYLLEPDRKNNYELKLSFPTVRIDVPRDAQGHIQLWDGGMD